MFAIVILLPCSILLQVTMPYQCLWPVIWWSDYLQGNDVGWRSVLTWWMASDLLISMSTAHRQPGPTPQHLSPSFHCREIWNLLSKTVLCKYSLGCKTCTHLAGPVKLKSWLPVPSSVLSSCTAAMNIPSTSVVVSSVHKTIWYKYFHF